MLQTSGVLCGRYTSPHLIDQWDCININGTPVKESVFREAEKLVQKRNKNELIKASEFELLTATAFECFAREKIEIGVIEVGLGGRLDATNVLENKAVTVISKIGVDHQSFLGNTIEEIALQKAGIMRPGVPCVLDRTNNPSVQKVVKDYAAAIGTEVILSSTDSALFDELSENDFEPHQWENLACAYTAFHIAYTKAESSLHRLIPAIKDTVFPGRLQTIDISQVTGRKEPALLDGAHNAQSADVLGAYVDKHLRAKASKVVWVLATSKGKELDDILKPLLRPEDCVTAVQFGPVEGMPWVEPMAPQDILAASSRVGVDASQQFDSTSNISNALQWAVETAKGGPLVIAGSLYLVSDVLRMCRNAEQLQNQLLSR
ncbi:hypothetical protein B7463_g8415, partial [Scytalidium lignicola]